MYTAYNLTCNTFSHNIMIVVSSQQGIAIVIMLHSWRYWRDMTIPVLVCAVLLYYGLAVCAAHDEEKDVIVLTTAHQLRKEIRSVLSETLAETLPELCDCQGYGNTTQPSIEYTVNAQLEGYIKDGLNEAVNNTVSELLNPLLSQLSHLLIPGLTPSHPATSCKEILQMDRHSPSGLYWIRGTEHPLTILT